MTTLSPMRGPRHEPVMLREAVEALAVKPGGRYVDATVGLGGHARAILEASQPGGRLLGIDRDNSAIAIANERLSDYGDAMVLAQGTGAGLRAVEGSGRWRAPGGGRHRWGRASR